jgi:hypothetical protein
MFLPDGTADGIKTVEKSNWVGRAVVFPRNRFADARKRPEFEKTGAYLLIGQGSPDDLPTVYVGEGDPVVDRLTSHYKLKDFWSTAVFFISKDENLNKAHVQYLESRLVELARDAKRSILDNNNVPQRPSLSEMDAADMEGFLEQMLLIFGVLGISVFQKPDIAMASTELLYLNAKGFRAMGYEVDEGFVVKAGSQSPSVVVPSIPPAVDKLRNTLLSQGVFVSETDHWRMNQDYTFTSPSIAAGVLLARSANGRIEWKDANGRTLKEIQEARVVS